MPPRGYTTPDRVQDFRGVALTGAQIAQCEALTLAVEARFDTYSGRSWLIGVQTDETHYGPFVGDLWVKHPPIVTLSAVKARTGLTATETTLVAGTDYEARDLAGGRIYLVSPASYDRLRVTYTPVTTLPEDVGLAATMQVAHWLNPAVTPDGFGIERFQLPDLSVTYARGFAGLELLPAVEELLEPFCFRAVA